MVSEVESTSEALMFSIVHVFSIHPGWYFLEVFMRKLVALMVVGLLCFIALPAHSQSIIVWDKDHNKLFPDPEGAGNVDPTYGITKALDDNGYTYDVTTSPNPDLSSYDILLLVMGIYC